MAFAQAQRRPIAGAVATLGVSERVAFLRRTYAHLGVALIAFAALTAGFMRFGTETSLKFSMWAMRGQWTWIAVIGLFMLVGWGAERLARSEASRGAQYAGLGLMVVAEAVILQPLLWIVMLKFGGKEMFLVEATAAGKGVAVNFSAAGPAMAVIGQAAVITIAIFVGLTATVFITKKDFSFMRGILSILTLGALGVILASAIFGFSLGAVFCGAMVALMGGYILFQTSMIMRDFPPSYHVAAALMLFSTIATLFWYVLQLIMSLKND
ncbi:MAG: Bax inhibitor-1 family protein [Kofleriaceae bacterium]